jgi:aminopeptidase-like protein
MNRGADGEKVFAEQETGTRMLRLAEELFPICRSITGNGVRESLKILNGHIPLQVTEVPSGSAALDWTVPREWNVRQAYVAKLDGARVIDFDRNNLHVVQYSTPLNQILPMHKLREHLHSLPEHPNWIPYRTSYYRETWGFCLTHRQLEAMTDEMYQVAIDSTLTDGHLTYGECVVEGETEREVLLSCHICHPSLANDNLSAIVVATMLAQYLRKLKRRYTYRFLFIPGTIGSLTWLSRNDSRLGLIDYGLVLSCLGDSGSMTYKQSRRGNSRIDRIVAHVLRSEETPHRILPFIPYGYDERQYCSPGFNLPVGCLMRTPNGEYDEYHSSADNLSLLHRQSLVHSLGVLQKIVEAIEGDMTYRNRNAKGEPQLGRRGLWGGLGGLRSVGYDQMALLWVLNLADGEHSLLDMAERSGLAFSSIRAAADALVNAELLERID